MHIACLSVLSSESARSQSEPRARITSMYIDRPIYLLLSLLIFVIGQQRISEAHLLHAAKAIEAAFSPTNLVKEISNALSDSFIGDVITNAKGKTSHNTTSVQDAANTKVNNCLGLGSIISSQLELLLQKKPNGTKAQNVRFYMTSRKKPHRVEVVIGKQFGLEWTDFEVRRNTVVIVHGFMSSSNMTWIHEMANAFILAEDVNVVAVDWGEGSETYNYYKAVFNTQTTGNQIATLFGQIANDTLERGGPPENQWGKIHCVGHSLGAHICGYAANEIKRRGAAWTIRRITGLDPAQPCFNTADLSLKLDKNDAPFVDVIHTNGRFLTDLGLGLPQPIGHIDFFPNGGKQQPGCEKNDFVVPLLSIPKEAINKAICNHGRSYLYFTESIVDSVDRKCTFWAYPWDRTYRNIQQILSTNLSTNCTSNMCTEMGINSDKYNFKGTFFALTAATRPYCHTGEWDREEVERILQEDYKDTLED